MNDQGQVPHGPVLCSLGEGGWPAVTCLCPTYGRFQKLRLALACFLAQDYPGEKRLLILNDSGVPIVLPEDGENPLADTHLAAYGIHASRKLQTIVINQDYVCQNLGVKRQALLKAAETPLVAHWDDDDLYLPWHLTMLAGRLLEKQAACPEQSRGVSCAKPGAAWWVLGPRKAMTVRGIRHNIFEGQMLFGRERALQLGGYPPKDSGQARDLLRAFGRAGEAETWNPPDHDVSYVYRWGDGVDHVSARKARQAAGFAAGRDHDFGDGQPPIPAELARLGGDAIAWARDRLQDQFLQLVAGCAAHLDRNAWHALRARLRAAVACDLTPYATNSSEPIATSAEVKTAALPKPSFQCQMPRANAAI